ncbi:MAG: MFS transporter, partial [Pseudomonas sp.]|uniref:MFS transporter n=1 Tax=Pseudomonas sp. TaxID=306 RepID=UPI003D6F0623
LAAGTFADRVGRKKVFLTGLVGFTVVSFLLGGAQSATALSLLRTIQGTFGAALLSAGSAMLASSFHAEAKKKALSWIGTSFGVGLALGPPVSGMLIDAFGWRSIFFLSSFLGILALIVGHGALKESRDPEVKEVDWVGILSICASLSLMTWAFLQAPVQGWTSFSTLAYLLSSLVALLIFINVQHRQIRPMLDLSLFKYAAFLAVQALPLATTCCYVVLLLLLPIRLVAIEGMSPAKAGVAMFTLSLPLMILPTVAVRLARRFSPAAISGLGLVIASIGLVLLSLREGGGMTELIIPLLIIGVGTGLPWGLMDSLSVSVVPSDRAGMASGVFNTVRLASESLGLALAGSVLALLISVQLPTLAANAFDLAQGNIGQVATVTQLDQSVIHDVYVSAFATLLRGLAIITSMLAVFVMVFLERSRTELSFRVT